MAIIRKPILERATWSNAPSGLSFQDFRRTRIVRFIDTDWKAKLIAGYPLEEMAYEKIIAFYSTPYGSAYLNRFGPDSAEPEKIPQMDIIDTYRVKGKSAAIEFATADLYKRAEKLRIGDLGVSLAELGQTIGLIGSAAARLAACYRHLRKLEYRQAARVLGISDRDNLRGVKFPSGVSHKTAKDLRIYLKRKSLHESSSKALANAWLEYTYGWTPLIYDVYTVAKAAAYANAKAPYDVTFSGSNTLIENEPGLHCSTAAKASGQSTFKCYEKHNFLVQNTTLRNMNNLGFTNPFIIAWELVPFSFVVDWFYPAGDYLRSLTAFSGLKWVSGSRSEKFLTSTTLTLESTPGYYGVTYKGVVGDGSFMWFTRELVGMPPFPVYPTIKLDSLLNVNHAITRLALLTSFKK